MSDKEIYLEEKNIHSRIITISNQQVMIDRDLAELYHVETKRLNEQVKRNINRFPTMFRFQLSDMEKNELVANCDRFRTLKHSTVNPYAFTEQGVAMLSAVLNSETAISVSIQVMTAFVGMRRFLMHNAQVFQRLDSLEINQIEHKKESNKKFNILFDALEKNTLPPKQGIFFDGQIFDSYIFISSLIKSAKNSIILIDNYVDDSVLTLFSKRVENCKVTIYTKEISKHLKLDLKKYNQQYPDIEIKELNLSHDRFLILDNKIIYHIGASLKDLGKKWFAFSKFEKGVIEVLSKLNEL